MIRSLEKSLEAFILGKHPLERPSPEDLVPQQHYQNPRQI